MARLRRMGAAGVLAFVLLSAVCARMAMAEEQEAARLEWSECFGGERFSAGATKSLTSDTAGGVYITLNRVTSRLPVDGGFDRTPDPFLAFDSCDLYAARFSPSGTRLWGTYVGGSGREEITARNVHVDPSGSLILVGWTKARDLPLAREFDSVSEGAASELFVTKILKDGRLAWMSYLGGKGDEECKSSKVDANGDLFVVGTSYPGDIATPGAFDATPSGNIDVFVARITSSGRLVYATYVGNCAILGPSQPRAGAGDTVLLPDDRGNAVLVTYVNGGEFWTSDKGEVTLDVGHWMTYAIKFDKDGKALWARLLGGYDDAMAPRQQAVMDREGNVYIAGMANRKDVVTEKGFDNTLDGEADIFVAKVTPDGKVAWSSYLGGSGCKEEAEAVDGEEPLAVALDACGNLIIGGTTRSADFPVQGGFDTEFSPVLEERLEGYAGEDGNWVDGVKVTRWTSGDLFLVKITPDGKLAWGTCVGEHLPAPLHDWIYPDQSGGIYLVLDGTHECGAEVFPAMNGFDMTYDFPSDVCVARISGDGRLMWGNILGGEGSDELANPVFDADGNVAVAVTTQAKALGTPNGFDHELSGESDGFVWVLSPEGELELGTYIGGSKDDSVQLMTNDAEGDLIVWGRSDSRDFPTTRGLDGPGGRHTMYTISKIRRQRRLRTIEGPAGGQEVSHHSEFKVAFAAAPAVKSVTVEICGNADFRTDKGGEVVGRVERFFTAAGATRWECTPEQWKTVEKTAVDGWVYWRLAAEMKDRSVTRTGARAMRVQASEAAAMTQSVAKE